MANVILEDRRMRKVEYLSQRARDEYYAQKQQQRYEEEQRQQRASEEYQDRIRGPQSPEVNTDDIRGFPIGRRTSVSGHSRKTSRSGSHTQGDGRLRVNLGGTEINVKRQPGDRVEICMNEDGEQTITVGGRRKESDYHGSSSKSSRVGRSRTRSETTGSRKKGKARQETEYVDDEE
jgi:hypothetical protein